MYDSYIKAFRWASDRIPQDEGGVVAFISNGAWLDSSTGSGIRRCFEEEFTSIYVLNLRGNQRTSGELSRKEGGKIFGSGSRTPIAITFLVKNPAKKGQKAVIRYHDIGDYLTREQKLKMVKEFSSISSLKLDWQIITPNEKADWINQRDGVFDGLIPLTPEKKKNMNAHSLFSNYSTGVITNRESWVNNSNFQTLTNSCLRLISFYNSETSRFISALGQNSSLVASHFVDKDETKIKWDEALFKDAQKGKKL